MTRRRALTAKRRTEVFVAAGGVCHICGHKIDAMAERWEADHVIPLAMGGEDEIPNLQPAHEICHRQKKTPQDQAHIAKSKRMQQRAIGVKRTVRNPIPGSKGTRFKKTVDGRVVDRRTGEEV